MLRPRVVVGGVMPFFSTAGWETRNSGRKWDLYTPEASLNGIKKAKNNPGKKKGKINQIPTANKSGIGFLFSMGFGWVGFFFWRGGTTYYWQKGEAVGSNPLKTSLREAASCWSLSCAGLFPAKGLPVPDFPLGFTRP